MTTPTMYVFVVLYFLGYLIVGVLFWDATEFGDFLASIFRALFWPLWGMVQLGRMW